jgi:hypothetical protein
VIKNSVKQTNRCDRFADVGRTHASEDTSPSLVHISYSKLKSSLKNNYDVGALLQDCQPFFSYPPFSHNSRDDVENIDISITRYPDWQRFGRHIQPQRATMTAYWILVFIGRKDGRHYDSLLRQIKGYKIGGWTKARGPRATLFNHQRSSGKITNQSRPNCSFTANSR